ncbi:MAG: hypothetical protein CMI54_04060 [Parcubacteria group bacterium]|nr:hypothetical protein [Parcubacteria group bacterium]|tara:strand:+ start:3116 stop:3556 length:441 start_codon:yes stop_codon:yes gene_type:complete
MAKKTGGPSLSMVEEEVIEEEIEEEIGVPKKEFDFNKYRIANKTEVRTLELDGAEFKITVKPLSWSKRNQILSKAMTWETGGGTRFDGDTYVRECLKEMILDAPWGKTSELFLMSIDDRLGGLLETVVPQAFGTEEIGDLDTLKEE